MKLLLYKLNCCQMSTAVRASQSGGEAEAEVMDTKT